MRRLAAILLTLWITSPVAGFAQNTQLPSAGEHIYRTEKGLEFDCPMSLNNSHHLVCADRLLSISRTAGEFNLASTATLSCSGAQCYLTFPVGSSATAYADWIMPSETLAVSSILISWHTAATTGVTQWYLDWCAYRTGEAPCTPSGANLRTYPSPVSSAGVRNDLRLSTWPWTNSWGTDTHVVWSLRREGYAPASGDTVNGDVLLESLRFEMTPE